MRPGIRVETGLPDGIVRLVEIGRAEGFSFVERLLREWHTGENRFAAPGEVFFGAYQAASLVGFGGLNRDPYCADPSVGRVRHVYLEPAARGSGLGGALVREIIERAPAAFVRLRLATRQAGPFYEHLGFVRVDEEHATHVFPLDRTSPA